MNLTNRRAFTTCGWPAPGATWSTGIPWDRDARPPLDEVLALRADRTATVRSVLGELTEEQLDSHTEPVSAPGWPEPVAYPVRECLRIVLNEEYMHRLYAERDLDALKVTQPSVPEA